MAKNITLQSTEPAKLPKRIRQVHEFVDARSEENRKKLRELFPLLEPRGPASSLKRAMTILGEVSEDYRLKIDFTVQQLIAADRERIIYPKNEMAKLRDIESAAFLLEARLRQLSFNSRIILLNEFKKLKDRNASNLDYLDRFEFQLPDIATASLQARQMLSKDGEGVSPRSGRPSHAQHTQDFLTSAITIFSAMRGEDSVTSTVTKSAAGTSCYTFCASLYRYALNRPLAHIRQFKALVAEFKKQRIKRASQSIKQVQNPHD